MDCPRCNTPNDPENQFCINCGQPLHEGSSASSTRSAVKASSQQSPLARSEAELVGVLTLRLVISLLGLWLLRVVLLWLPFTRTLRIPDIPLTIQELITSIIYLIVIGILVGYARALGAIWPRAFPRYRDASVVFVLIVYLGVLVAAYYAFLPIIRAFATGTDALVIFQVILFIIAAILLGSATVTLYQRLPAWLSSLRKTGIFTYSRGEVACLNCGQLNPTNAKHCTNCGHPLSAEAE